MKESKSLKCKVRGCDRPYYTKKNQLCPAHLMRLRRKGKTGDDKLRDYGKPKDDK